MVGWKKWGREKGEKKWAKRKWAPFFSPVFPNPPFIQNSTKPLK
jgi:hypothetical protein